MAFDFDYIILNLVMLYVFYVCGKKIQQGANYWINALWMIVVFTFVLGSRYLRGNDYYQYSENFLNNSVRGNQWIFLSLNDILQNLGFDKYTCFYAYSFIEITCALFFLKRYACYGKYIFPFFLMATIVFNEYQIRQALSFSFIFLYLGELFNLERKDLSAIFLLNEEKVYKIAKALVFLIIAGSIHSVNYLLAIAFTLIYFFIRFPLPIFITIPSVFFCQYVASSVFDFSIFNTMLSYFSQDDLLSVYVDNGSQWFSAEGFEDKYNRNIIAGMLECVGTSCLFYLGHSFVSKAQKKSEFTAMYNIFVLGILFQMSFRNLELLNRIGGDMAMMWFLPLSLVLFHRNQLIELGCKKIAFWGLCWYAYEFIRYLFLRGEPTLFLWDK